jgi:atypical dual specificity phosphatase
VLHCRAGLGRTGTLLACALVRGGLDAGRAIRAVRQANPRYIQTEGQLQFVSEFQAYMEHQDGRGSS